MEPIYIRDETETSIEEPSRKRTAHEDESHKSEQSHNGAPHLNTELFNGNKKLKKETELVEEAIRWQQDNGGEASGARKTRNQGVRYPPDRIDRSASKKAAKEINRTIKREKSLRTAAESGMFNEKKQTISQIQLHHNALVKSEMVEIAAKRSAFIAHHTDYFRPLLPPKSALTTAHSGSDNSYPKIIPHREFTTQPKYIKAGQMKGYQLHGLAFLAHMYANGMPAILADEMGLGKTLQTLALFAHIREEADEKRRQALANNQKKEFVHGPHLIIAPMSVLSAWCSEITRWLPEFTFIRFHAQKTERERLKKVAKEKPFDICITTYEQFSAEDNWFKTQIAWVLVVLDEG